MAPALSVVRPVYNIANVVHEAGDTGQLDGAVIVPQYAKDLCRSLRHLGNMAEGVLGVAHFGQISVRPADVLPNVLIFLNGLKCDLIQCFVSPRCCMVLFYLCPVRSRG